MSYQAQTILTTEAMHHHIPQAPPLMILGMKCMLLDGPSRIRYVLLVYESIPLLNCA